MGRLEILKKLCKEKGITINKAEVPITVAQRLMGHSDIKMTAQIYTHHTPKSFEDARHKIEEYHLVKENQDLVEDLVKE